MNVIDPVHSDTAAKNDEYQAVCLEMGGRRTATVTLILTLVAASGIAWAANAQPGTRKYTYNIGPRPNGATRMRVRYWMSAAMLGLLMVPGMSDAAVTQESFLLRNASDLVDVCSAAQSDPFYTAAANFCQGFVVGVFRVLNEETVADPSMRLFCLPEHPPTRNEGIVEFVHWAKSNSSQLGQSPADAVAAFLSQRFPCQSGVKSGGAAR